MEQYRTVSVANDARGMLTVALDRPQAANALNAQMVAEILAVMESAARDSSVRVVVLRGRGDAFSGAMDLDWAAEMARAERQTNLNDAKTLARMLDVVDSLPRPVVAAVHGAVVGDALGLIAACDIVVASAETTFSLPHLQYGLSPSCVAPFLIAKTGGSHARNLMLTGRSMDAERAQEVRLVHEIVAHPAALDDAVNCVAADLRLASPRALKECKRLIRRLTYHGHSLLTSDTLEDVATCLADSRASADAAEGVAAYREQRASAWAT